MTQKGSSDLKKVKAASELAEFDGIFLELVDTLTKEGIKKVEIADACTWFKEMLIYNVPHGKKNRGVSVVSSFKHLVPDASDEDLKIAHVLGWCVELVQGFFFMSDDVMDHSLTRRGNPCWYKKENVGLIAINDSYFIESSVYCLLRKYVKGKPYYVHAMELFLESTLQTVIGQCLDLITAPPEAKVDFTQFTMERHGAITKCKTSYYSFYLPVALALYMAGIYDEDSHAKAKTILMEIGHFYQVQDDYLDNFGSPEVTGKVGTDIQDNKCSWLIVRALEIASEQQKEDLKTCYGRWDEDAVKKVKVIYNDLNMETEYRNYEEQSVQKIKTLIESMESKVPQQIFLDFVYKIYKREK